MLLVLVTVVAALALEPGAALRYNYGDGSYYVGNVDESGRPQGTGQFYNKEGKLEYEGSFAHGLAEGNGTWFFADGSRLTGQFHEGHANGHGVLRHPNGDKIEGTFKDHLPDGFVSMTMSGGERIEGQFKHGLPHGRVTWRNRNGMRFHGDFRMGKPHGKGKIYNQEGLVIHDGRFIGGKAAGNLPSSVNMEDFKYRHGS